MRCPASVIVEASEPDESSPYAEEGTLAHSIAAAMLEGKEVPGSPEMLEAVGFYVDTVKAMAGEDGEILVEQRVDFSRALGVENAFGTSDCIIISGETLQIVDFKYGTGVKVDAHDNEQMMLYALGALDTLDLNWPIENVLMAIIQPRVGNVSTWMIPTKALLEFKAKARIAADKVAGLSTRVLAKPDFTPGEKQCRFCKYKNKCQALAEHVYETVAAQFEDLETTELLTNAKNVEMLTAKMVGELMNEVDLIESWCKSLRARCERDLSAGIDVPGWKLVQGRPGNRKWADPDHAAALLMEMGISETEIYERALISPTAVEKLMKAGELSKEQFASLGETITRSEGKAVVAPTSDRRPGISQADLFAN